MRSRKAIADTIRSKLNFVVDPPLREQLLARARQEQKQSWTTQPAPKEPNVRATIMRRPMVRIVLAALIGTGVVGAAAVGVGYKYHFFKTEEGGHQVVVSEDGRRAWNFSPETAGDPRQAVQTAEELDRLIQEGKKELVNVHETEVNGRLDHRLLQYRYTLSDGRTVDLFEDDPETGPGTLTKEQKEEADRLWREGAGRMTGIASSDGSRRLFTAQGREILTTERVVQGRTFKLLKVTVTLADGTEVARSIGLLR